MRASFPTSGEAFTRPCPDTSANAQPSGGHSRRFSLVNGNLMNHSGAAHGASSRVARRPAAAGAIRAGVRLACTCQRQRVEISERVKSARFAGFSAIRRMRYPHQSVP